MPRNLEREPREEPGLDSKKVKKEDREAWVEEGRKIKQEIEKMKEQLNNWDEKIRKWKEEGHDVPDLEEIFKKQQDEEKMEKYWKEREMRNMGY